MTPTEEQLRMMRHAVSERWSRYVSAKGTQEDSDWAALERAGLAREFRDGICTRTWHVTEAGQALLRSLDPSPQPQPSERVDDAADGEEG